MVVALEAGPWKTPMGVGNTKTTLTGSPRYCWIVLSPGHTLLSLSVGMEVGPTWVSVSSRRRKSTYYAESMQQGPMDHL